MNGLGQSVKCDEMMLKKIFLYDIRKKIILKNFFCRQKSDEKNTVIHKPLKNSKMDRLRVKKCRYIYL